MARRRRRDERPIPAHPYRDTSLLYGAMATFLVVLAALTGGDVARSAVVAAIFFVVATAWSWWRFRARIRLRDAAVAAATGAGDPGPENGTGGGDGM